MKAWVVFDDGNGLKSIGRFLRPGFKHCWLLVNDGGGWVTIDSMAGHLELTVPRHIGPDFDLAGWHRDEGGTIVEAAIGANEPPRAAPVALLTCVEVIKRFLCIHDAFIFTPYQLYRHLKEAERVRSEENVFPERGGGAQDGAENRPV